MKSKPVDYKRYFSLGIIIVSLGVIFSTVLSTNYRSLGVVFVAIGGFLIIVAMSKKRKIESGNDK